MSKGWLLDTSILSAFAPGKPPVPEDFADWLRTHAGQLYIPCIAIAELEQGIGKLRRAGGAKRADALTKWLDGLLTHYAERILPLDAAVSREAGRMSAAAIAAGQHPGFADIAIAALAQHAGLSLLTRNLRHFQPLGVECLDPFVRLPA